MAFREISGRSDAGGGKTRVQNEIGGVLLDCNKKIGLEFLDKVEILFSWKHCFQSAN